EALVIGVLASVAGLFLGLALARGLNSLFVSFGIDLPQTSTVFATRTVVISLAVGVLVTLAAARRPALRSTRVPPWPATRLGAASGALARGNAMRAPARTASTASALMIGLALVTLVGVLAAGLRTRFRDGVNQAFVADYAVTASNGFSPVDISLERALVGVPGVELVTGVRGGDGKAFGKKIRVTAVSPGVSNAIAVKWKAGSPRTPDGLGQTGAFVTDGYAAAHRLRIGSPITMRTPTGMTLGLV